MNLKTAGIWEQLASKTVKCVSPIRNAWNMHETFQEFSRRLFELYNLQDWPYQYPLTLVLLNLLSSSISSATLTLTIRAKSTWVALPFPHISSPVGPTIPQTLTKWLFTALLWIGTTFSSFTNQGKANFKLLWFLLKELKWFRRQITRPHLSQGCREKKG